jgi:hypothetical protein
MGRGVKANYLVLAPVFLKRFGIICAIFSYKLLEYIAFTQQIFRFCAIF